MLPASSLLHLVYVKLTADVSHSVKTKHAVKLGYDLAYKCRHTWWVVLGWVRLASAQNGRCQTACWRTRRCPWSWRPAPPHRAGHTLRASLHCSEPVVNTKRFSVVTVSKAECSVGASWVLFQAGSHMHSAVQNWSKLGWKCVLLLSIAASWMLLTLWWATWYRPQRR